MLKFKDILTESKGQIVFAFGRFNPPTTGHEKLINKVKQVAGGSPYRIYPSFSQNAKKDPLPHSLKVAYMRKMFRNHAKNIIADKESITAMHIAVKLYDEGFRNLVMVAGSDRVKEFDSLLKKYNGVTGKRHGYYKFDTIDVISAGERDPDAEGVEGMSASKMRAAATAGDFDSFKTGLPGGFKDALKLYNDIRKYMGIREERDMGDMNDFETLRDLYLTGKIWNVGNIVESNSGAKGKVIRKGTNYLSFVDEDNKVHKAWLYDIVERDYKKEYERYQGTPEQIARRSSRNKARRIMGDKAVKGMDVGHIDNNPMNNDPTNLRNENPSDNRREPRLRDEKYDSDKFFSGKGTPAQRLQLLKLQNKALKAFAGSPKQKAIKKDIYALRKKMGMDVKEELGKDATQKDYIDDFIKSDAPQFKGKDKDKRIAMAIAAYKSKNESYQIDEALSMTIKGKGKEKYRLGYDQKFTLNGKGYMSTGVTKQQVYVAKGPEGEKVFSKKELEQLLKKGDLKFFDMGPINQEEIDIEEKPYMRTDPKLKNLKVPVRRKSGRMIKTKGSVDTMNFDKFVMNLKKN